MATKSLPPTLERSLHIATYPDNVLNAFFDPNTLKTCWDVVRSVTTPRPLGPYVLEWPLTDRRDDELGRFGGVFRGTVIHFESARGFFVADGFWLPPDGEPIGPTALDVNCAAVGENLGKATRLRVTLRGGDNSRRWRRYYDLMGQEWDRALASLKQLLER